MRALVNNAAVALNVPVEAFAIDEWRRLFEVNLFGHITVTQTLLPAPIRSKGRVVNISSVGGQDRHGHLWSLRRHEVRARSGE